MRRLILALCCFILPAAAHAQGESGKIALVGGTLIDGMRIEPLHDSVILIENGVIRDTGTEGALAVPKGYRVISTEGMSVLPGLWDSHVHLMITGHADYDHWDRTYPPRFAGEIMPASAYQLLMAGVTTARDVGAPLDDSLAIRARIEAGEIAGPRLFISGPFLQHEPYPDTEAFRWGVADAADARAKVRRLAEAGVDLIKLVDQDLMSFEAAEALVDEAHRHDLPVIGHSHRPDEIRRGVAIGVDNFEHTGLAAAPEYPADVMALIKERTATGRVHGGPLFWTPTVEGLWNYEDTLRDDEFLDDDCWHAGLRPETVADIAASIAHPERLPYFQLTAKRKPTLKRKVLQLREAGVVLLIGTDSGIPMKFHCQSTWNELDLWTRAFGIPAMEAIRAATYWPSVLMKVSNRWGTVTPGQYADIIAVRGNVLKHMALLQDVDFVMKGGVVYKQNGRPLVKPPIPAE